MLVTFKKETSLFEQGLELHRAGRYAEAEAMYRQILAREPNHFDALHMLGLVAHQTGRTLEGIGYIERAVQANPNVATAWSNLAEIKRHAGALPDAENAGRRAIAMDPNNSAAHVNLAMVLNQMRRFEESLPFGMRAIELTPREPGGYSASGVALMEMKRWGDAAIYLEEALKLVPDDWGVMMTLMQCSEAMEHNDRAYQLSKRTVEIAGHLPHVKISHATLLLRLEKFAEARVWVEKLVAEDPNNRLLREIFAVSLHTVREFDRAIELVKALIAEMPDRVDLYPSLAESLMGIGKFDEAMAAMEKAIATRPMASQFQTYSNAYVRTGQLERGLKELEKGIAMEPKNAVLHFNKSVILLLMGRYKEAWLEYEWRWQHPRMVGRTRAFRQPQWKGEKLNGQRVLLHGEQGIGDTIFFGRYAKLVADRGGRPIVFAQNTVVDLVKTIPGVAGVVGENQPFPEFDMHCAIMTLPLVFGTTLENIPTWHKYISTNPEKSAYWKAELANRTGKFKVGLVWEGGAFQPENYLRSASLPEYAPLGGLKDVAFFGLQKGPAEAQSTTPPEAMDFTNLGPFIKDFTDTAAIIENLDLLISIDTSVVHVAAALGKPIWMGLAYSPGHMWMLEREDTPWYPTQIRIFRQPGFRDWDTPVKRMTRELSELLAQGHDQARKLVYPKAGQAILP